MKRPYVVCPIVVVIAATLLTACDSQPSPLAPSPQVPTTQAPPPTGNFRLQGMVMDTAFRPLAGAQVEVTSGADAGRSALSDSSGQFVLSGNFDETTQVRATKDGFVARTQALSPRCATCAYFYTTFYLMTPEPSLNIAGNYNLTFIADAACTALPPDARTRTYDIRIESNSAPHLPENTIFTARVTRPSLVQHYDAFPIGVVANFATFELRGHGPYLLEQTGDDSYLGFDGLAGAIFDAEPLPPVTTRFDGWIGFCSRVTTTSGGQYYDCGRGRAECLSSNHQLILRKR